VPTGVSQLVRVYGWMIPLRKSGVVYAAMLFRVVPLISVLSSLNDSLTFSHMKE
jgi:ABC-type spermidine/putrescine transport system permease subunit I